MHYPNISFGLSVSQKILDDIGLCQRPAKLMISDCPLDFETRYFKRMLCHKTHPQKNHQSHIIEVKVHDSIELIEKEVLEKRY